MKKYLTIIMLTICIFSTNARAAVTVIQALDFGEFIVKNNNSVGGITINTDGSYTFDTGIFAEIVPPEEGIYDIDGLTPSTAISSVVVTEIAPLTGSIGPNLNMTAFQETHPASTDALGEARITIGATANTTGSTANYPDQTYSGTVNIQINY